MATNKTATKKTNPAKKRATPKKSTAKKAPARAAAAVTKPVEAGTSSPLSADTPATAATVRAELAKLGKAALQKKFREVFGRAPKSDNVHHLRTALAKKLVPEQPATSVAVTQASSRPAKERDARLPATGTLINRPYKGVTHEVKVLEDGFEYGGAQHRSLSAIARAITGQQTNGFLWFGLIPRNAKPPTPTEGAEARAPAARLAKKAAKG